MTRIVIIGAGAAGINAAQTLASKLKPADNVEVVVIEKSKYFYHTIGAPRAYTEASFAAKMFVPYDHAIPSHAASFVKIVRAVATAISAETNEVSYKKIGEDDKAVDAVDTVHFDYLIVATGSTYTVPIKQDSANYSRANTEAQLKEVRDAIANANSILVVGGGAVGCEVAGDIASHFPDKQVTIVESRDKLVAGNALTDRFYSYLNASLAKLKIKVILGERLEERLTGNAFQKRTLKTDKGTVIESDVQLLCGGFHPVAELVHAMDPSVVDANGAIKVNDLLQLDHEKYRHIFALGDVVNHKTPKLAYWAGKQAKHVAGELANVVRKSQPAVRKPFPAVTTETLVLPLGPNGGVSQLPVLGGSVLGDLVTRSFKAKDMFAGRFWGSLGATVPN